MDPGAFREAFPEFAGTLDSAIDAAAAQAACFVHVDCCADLLTMLMVAHLLATRAATASGGGAAVSSASEGSVSVTMATTSDTRARALWLNTTPYGQQYAALEQQCAGGQAAAGIYFGVLPEQAAFRRVGGVFR